MAVVEEKKKKRINGGRKGSSFERNTCRALSLWLSEGTDGDWFWRTAASGGRATIRGDRTLAHAAGDIGASKPEGFALVTRYFIECKHYANLQLGNFLCHKKSKLGDFWEIAYREALKYYRLPILIAKQNLFPTLVIMRRQCWLGFDMHHKPVWSLGNDKIVVALFEEFIAYASREKLYERVRMTKKVR